MNASERNRMIEGVLPWATKLIVARARGRRDYEDVRQDCYLRLVKVAADYDPARALPSTWCAMVLGTYLPRRLKRPEPSYEPHQGDDCDGRAVDPAVALERAEDGRRVRSALDRLDPFDREMIVGHAIDGRPLADLDRGVSREACRTRYDRALARCRRGYELAAGLGGS